MTTFGGGGATGGLALALAAAGAKTVLAARRTEMLEEVVASDERALVFTQYAEMGRLLQHFLRQSLDREVFFLHGGTPMAERDRLVSEFQNDANGPPVFILSLKAGGTGLNLTRVPEVLIECGNMRNSTDARLLTSAQFQRRIASALEAAIIRFLRRR